jgi:hypothetical protein
MTSVRTCNELELTDALTGSMSGVGKIAFLAHGDGYRFVILQEQEAGWGNPFTGELSRDSLKVLERLVRNGRLVGKIVAEKAQLPAAGKPLTPFVETFLKRAAGSPLDFEAVQSFFRDWKRRTESRAAIQADAKNAVYARAGGCCEYAQCGEPLFKRDGKLGNFGYLAHIVGAIKGGPRGDYPYAREKLNSDDNVLLLCDFHHRLIDRIEPDIHTVEVLQRMRDDSVLDRENYALFRRLPQARILTITSDIMGVSTDINRAEAVDALRKRGFRSDSHLALSNYFGDRRGGNDERNPVYWENFLENARADIYNLTHALRGDGALGVSGQPVGVFAVGNMPALLLAGRIIGEARPILFFHRDRNRMTFDWSVDEAPPNSVEVTYSLGESRELIEDVLISIEVTADLDQGNLPPVLRDLPQIRVRSLRQGQNAIASDTDLLAFRKAVQDAINLAQDSLRAKTIHFVTIAPAICVLATGMKIQARNHSRIVMYQPSKNRNYFKAISISGQKVEAGGVEVEIL